MKALSWSLADCHEVVALPSVISVGGRARAGLAASQTDKTLDRGATYPSLVL